MHVCVFFPLLFFPRSRLKRLLLTEATPSRCVLHSHRAWRSLISPTEREDGAACVLGYTWPVLNAVALCIVGFYSNPATRMKPIKIISCTPCLSLSLNPHICASVNASMWRAFCCTVSIWCRVWALTGFTNGFKDMLLPKSCWTAFVWLSTVNFTYYLLSLNYLSRRRLMI